MRIFYFLLLFGCAQLCSAQNYHVLLNAQPKFLGNVSIAQLSKNQLFISMPFAKDNILNPEQKKQLKEKVVIRLELVYTKYRKSVVFNQKELNKKRLKELNRLVPNLFENRFWDFELISQTHGNSQEECNKMFHGFIVTFRPNSTKKTLDLEANYLEKLLAFMVKKNSLDQDTTPMVFDIKTHYDKQFGYIHDTVWGIDTATPPSVPDFFYDQALYNDSTVLNAFNRNQSWDNFIVVTDVTGSMSPYISQVIVWLKAQANNKKANYFVFFNDGDQKPSSKKKPLETKGIYIVKNKSLDAVIKTTTKCMRNGSGGGESLENDIEAILEGIKQYPDVNEIILIADNLESMRDYKFLKKIKKPVHIILCAAKNRINVQYLDLARQTNGTVHTIKNDVINLNKLKENDHFFVDEKEYLLKNGRFHSIYKKF